MDSVQEGSHETIDRVWRRWLQFCQNEVGAIDPLLHDAPTADVGLLLRAFFELNVYCTKTKQFLLLSMIKPDRKERCDVK